MTTAAELWNRLDEGMKVAAFRALDHYLGDAGAELIRAIAAESDAVMHALPQTDHTGPDPYPYLLPPEAAGPATEPQRCQECGRPVNGELYARVVYENGSKRIRWVGEGCWEIWRQRGVVEDGEQLQAFPTPMPIREQP